MLFTCSNGKSQPCAVESTTTLEKANTNVPVYFGSKLGNMTNPLLLEVDHWVSMGLDYWGKGSDLVIAQRLWTHGSQAGECDKFSSTGGRSLG